MSLIERKICSAGFDFQVFASIWSSCLFLLEKITKRSLICRGNMYRVESNQLWAWTFVTHLLQAKDLPSECRNGICVCGCLNVTTYLCVCGEKKKRGGLSISSGLSEF